LGNKREIDLYDRVWLVHFSRHGPCGGGGHIIKVHV